MKSFLLSFIIVFSNQLYGASINSKDFIDCFEKAFNERVSEIKDEYHGKGKSVDICDGMSSQQKDMLIGLYSEIQKGKLVYYSAEDMGQTTVRQHYERLMFKFECYPAPKFILTNFIQGFGSAINLYKKTNFDLVEEVFSKILGQKMWSENGSDYLSEHEFSYCFQ